MSGYLTIYECPNCGIHGHPSECACYLAGSHKPVRVFREEDVRLLWEEADFQARYSRLEEAVDSFPAPEDWR